MQVLLRRVVHYSFTNIFRNKLLSLGTIIVISVVVFFMNILSATSFLAEENIRILNKKIDFSIELLDTADVNAPVVEDLKGDLEAIGVKVEKITREQALATFESMRPDFQSFRMKYGLENPLPASLYVTNVEVRQFPLLKEVMEKASYREVINVDINESTFRDQEERISKWRGVILFVETLLFWMRFAFLLVAILITVSTIRIILLSRQKEIEIMELVGASYTFIRAPFILEGMLYSFVAVLFGLFFYNSFLGELAAQMGRAHMDQFLLSQLIAVQSYFASHALWIFFEQAVLFLCVGALSSFVALSKGFSRKGLSARLPWSSPSAS